VLHADSGGPVLRGTLLLIRLRWGTMMVINKAWTYNSSCLLVEGQSRSLVLSRLLPRVSKGRSKNTW
jgi:hypothetical protein